MDETPHAAPVILELEHAGWASLCDGTAARFYGTTMTPDAHMILGDGSVMTRDDVVAALADAPTWDKYSIDDPVVYAAGDDVRVLVYRGTGRRGEQRFVGAMSSVYQRSQGGWRLVLYQQTPLAAR